MARQTKTKKTSAKQTSRNLTRTVKKAGKAKGLSGQARKKPRQLTATKKASRAKRGSAARGTKASMLVPNRS